MTVSSTMSKQELSLAAGQIDFSSPLASLQSQVTQVAGRHLFSTDNIDPLIECCNPLAIPSLLSMLAQPEALAPFITTYRIHSLIERCSPASIPNLLKHLVELKPLHPYVHAALIVKLIERCRLDCLPELLSTLNRPTTLDLLVEAPEHLNPYSKYPHNPCDLLKTLQDKLSTATPTAALSIIMIKLWMTTLTEDTITSWRSDNKPLFTKKKLLTKSLQDTVSAFEKEELPILKLCYQHLPQNQDVTALKADIQKNLLGYVRHKEEEKRYRIDFFE